MECVKVSSKDIPSGEDPDEVQSEELKKSDIYLLILGCEYGTETGFSPTHKEYEEARFEFEFDRDRILIYVKNNEDTVRRREERLKNWIENIKLNCTYKEFEDLNELKEFVKDRLRNLWHDKFEGMSFGDIGVYGSVKDLTPDDFDIQKYHDAYISRESDETIKEALKEGKDVLITGRPMIGKTRAAFEAIKQTDEFKGFDLLKLLPIGLEPEIVIKRELKGNTILFLDDLNKFVGISSRIQYLINRLKESRYNLPIIATCRSGGEQKKAKEEFTTILRDFEEIEIEDISREEGEKLASDIKLKFDGSKFDQTPGSVTLDLKDMKVRYDGLEEEPRIIFRILKILVKGN
jgi:hypothetical protein